MIDFHKIIRYARLGRSKSDSTSSLVPPLAGWEKTEKDWTLVLALFFTLIVVGGIFDVVVALKIRNVASGLASNVSSSEVRAANIPAIKKAAEILKNREAEQNSRISGPAPADISK